MRSVSTFKRKLKNGQFSWGYRFDTAPVDGVRKQTSKSGFSQKKEALKAGILALQQYDNIGKVVHPSDMSFSDYLDLWMKKDCEVNLKITTIENYKKKIKNHIKPNLGKYRLNAIKREDLQAFVIDLFDNGLAKNTISSIIGILTKAFNYAIDNNYLQYSPATRINIPKKRTPKIKPKTIERVVIPKEAIKAMFIRFPETAPSHIPLRLGYECGLRIGEAFALVWEDIDFDNLTIKINRQIQWQDDKERTKIDKLKSNGSKNCGSGYWYFSNPKYDSFRVIDISESFANLLKREKKRQIAMKTYYGEYYAEYYTKYPIIFEPSKDNDIINPISCDGENKINFVCVRDNGTYISTRTMQHTSNVIKKDIFSKFSYHCFRHTHASILSNDKSINPKYISERLGHKNEQITREVYTHQTEDSREHGKSKINELFN